MRDRRLELPQNAAEPQVVLSVEFSPAGKQIVGGVWTQNERLERRTGENPLNAYGTRDKVNCVAL